MENVQDYTLRGGVKVVFFVPLRSAHENVPFIRSKTIYIPNYKDMSVFHNPGGNTEFVFAAHRPGMFGDTGVWLYWLGKFDGHLFIHAFGKEIAKVVLKDGLSYFDEAITPKRVIECSERLHNAEISQDGIMFWTQSPDMGTINMVTNLIFTQSFQPRQVINHGLLGTPFKFSGELAEFRRRRFAIGKGVLTNAATRRDYNLPSYWRVIVPAAGYLSSVVVKG